MMPPPHEYAWPALKTLPTPHARFSSSPTMMKTPAPTPYCILFSEKGGGAQFNDWLRTHKRTRIKLVYLSKARAVDSEEGARVLVANHQQNSTINGKILAVSKLSNRHSRRHPAAADPDGHAAKDAEVVPNVDGGDSG